MLFWTIVKVALKTLLANKLRSFLAMLGIIIGVGAVISMLALAAGARSQVMSRITSMGTNLLVIRPGQRRRRGVRSGSYQNLKLEDAEAIVREVPGVAEVAPVVMGGAQLKYYGRNTSCSVVGTSITYFPIRSFEVEKGRCFTEVESERLARVAVLGPATADALFGESDPLGEIFKLKGINFRVIGVLKSKGDQGWFNPDDQALVPYSTAMKQLFGTDHLREIDIRAEDGADLDAVVAGTTALLRRRHRLAPEEDDDFHIRNQAELLEMASTVLRTFTILLGSIAGISLLVGGIGIMNIMLVTVAERTREIGVRKAIGARDRDILGQFLFESILLSGLGGVLGIGFGVGIARLISWASKDFITVVEPLSVILALSVSAAVGIFFGFYPALRASWLDPIEALRYE
ncbi:MAG: ABC transporter permease [Planctomycetota bacterium]